MFTYSIRRDDVSEWLTLGGDQVNSSNTIISKPLCTTDRTSATPTASFTIGCRDADKYRTTVDYILNAWKNLTKVHARIKKDGIIVASGYIDSSSLNIQSSAIPENLTLSIRDYIVDLDRKIESVNFVADQDDKDWKGGITVLQAVTKVLNFAGYIDEIICEPPTTRRVAHFSVTEDDGCTYREKIDKILFEAPGLVLWRNPETGKYHIRSLSGNTTGDLRLISYHVASKLKTKHSICDEDGVKVIYPTVNTEDRTVYTADINTGYNDEGIYQGVVLAPGDYWPENGDIQTTYLEYEKDLLDRPYQEKKSRLQNSDLDLLYVRDADMTFRASADLELPVINSIGLLKNPSFFPRKAMVLLHNGSDKNISLERLTITGKATYISKLNRMTLPFDAEDPREYESDYIFDEATAKEFAAFYFNHMTIGASVATWVEWEGASNLSELGESVMVRHKGTEKAQGYLICQIDDKSLSGGVRCRNVTAIAVTDYDAYTVRSETNLVSSGGKRIIAEEMQYYSSDGPYELAGGEWSNTASVSPDKYLWTRRHIIYSDGTHMYTDPIPNGTPGMSEKVEYAKNNDPTTHPVDDTDFVFNGEPLVFNGQNMTWASIWTEAMPTIGKGEYLWRRAKAVGSTTWTYARITPEKGEDAKQFFIKSYSGSFIKDLRNTGTQSIRVNVSQSGYTGDMVLESSSGTVTGENGSYLVTVPMNLNALVLRAYSIIPSAGEFSSSIYYFSKDPEGKYSRVEATSENYMNYYMAEAWDITEIYSIDKTSYEKYIGVYDNVSEIPSSDSEGLIINGDYALVRYDANGKFALTAYEKINEAWVISSDPTILAETTSDAVNEAKIEYEKGGTVNYIDLFYSHKAYIDNLSATVINVSDIYAGDIQSFEYAEDENGYPASGYKLEYKGGTDGKGMIKTVGLNAKNCTFSNSTIERDCQVYGTIVNKDGDNNTVLKTVQETVPVTTMSASKTDGISKPDAFLWSDYKALIKNRITGRTADTVYSCTANINGKSFKSYCNKTTARTLDEIPSHPSYHIGNYGDAEVYYDYPFDYANGEIFYLRANKSVFTLTIPPNYPIVTIRRFWVDPDSQGVNGGKNYRSYHGAFTVTLENSTIVTMLASGNEVEITPEMSASGNYPPVDAKLENLVMHPGETLRVTFYVIQRQFTSDEVPPDRRKMNANVYFSIVEADIWTTGIKLIDTDGYIYEADSVIPSGGWGTTAQVFNDSGVNYSLNMVADSSWAIRKYYRFQWNSAPPNTSNKTSSFIDDGSYLEYNGAYYYSSGIGSATYGTSGLTIVTSSGASFPFVVGNYYSQYSILIKTRDSLPGVYAKNLMPIDTTSQIGGADSSHLWQGIYCNTIYSNNSASVSKRSLKENIKEWEGNATDLLNQVDVVEFNYISDPDKTYHIGFIADDTDEMIAGKNHDRMDVTNCIGVLIKAIQQLSARITELEGELNGNGI